MPIHFRVERHQLKPCTYDYKYPFHLTMTSLLCSNKNNLSSEQKNLGKKRALAISLHYYPIHARAEQLAQLRTKVQNTLSTLLNEWLSNDQACEDEGPFVPRNPTLHARFANRQTSPRIEQLNLQTL